VKQGLLGVYEFIVFYVIKFKNKPLHQIDRRRKQAGHTRDTLRKKSPRRKQRGIKPGRD
jgi:hypothetical protein